MFFSLAILYAETHQTWEKTGNQERITHVSFRPVEHRPQVKSAWNEWVTWGLRLRTWLSTCYWLHVQPKKENLNVSISFKNPPNSNCSSKVGHHVQDHIGGRTQSFWGTLCSLLPLVCCLEKKVHWPSIVHHELKTSTCFSLCCFPLIAILAKAEEVVQSTKPLSNKLQGGYINVVWSHLPIWTGLYRELHLSNLSAFTTEQNEWLQWWA